MADIDIDPFAEHESRPEEPTDEHIPLDPITPGRSTWEPDRGEQETSFGNHPAGESHRTKLMKDYVRDLYKKLSENIDETPELFHYDYFKLEGVRELLGLDKQLRSIRGSLKVEVAKKVELEGHIEMEKIELGEIQDDPRYTKKQHEELRKRLDKLNDELKVRQESIDLLKGRLKSQITSFKETIAKVLDIDTSLGEKIRTLFREQGITIASILTAIGMAIGVLVEALLPGGAATHQEEVVNHLLKMRKV